MKFFSRQRARKRANKGAHRNSLALEHLEPRLMLSTTHGIADVEQMELQNDSAIVEVSDVNEGAALGQLETASVAVSVLGDANGDGELNFNDVAPFLQALFDPTEFATAFPNVDPNTTLDFFGDGSFDFLDVAGFLSTLIGGEGSDSEIVVRARGDEGGEQFNLLINGSVVASYTTTTEFENFSYTATGQISANDVRVEFTNDFWDPANGIDNNLIVDFISIDDQVFQTEDPLVFSTGSWTEIDGIVPGYHQVEALNANGYFQFAETSGDPGSLALNGNFSIVSESGGSVGITINRLGGSFGTVSIDYETVPLTASAGLDYVPVEGTLEFLTGETSKTIQIQIVEDDLTEDSERFSFTIDNAQGGAGLLSPRTAIVEISDDPGSGTNGPGAPELSVTTEILAEIAGAVAFDWTPDGSKMFVAEAGGAVYVLENNQLVAEPFIDISDQVNGPRGLLDIAIHPDFENQPYVYLGFAYDPPEVNQFTGLAGPDGLGNRASRLVRVTADVNAGYLKAIPGSEVVLLGTNSTWNNYNGFVDSTVDFDEPQGGVNPDGSYVQDFLAGDSQSHTIGAVEFGPDGALYVANGDGASFNAVDPRAARVQDIDSLSGKIIRIDPLTGEGLEDNPFYDGDPNSNRSKVYQSGLRNPFRITFDDATGQLFVGDVGWFLWEEVNSGPAGANFGWPYFEGGDAGSIPTPVYSELPEATAFYATNPTVVAPLLGLNHVDDEIDAIIVGDVYSGDVLPEEYRGNLIFNHLASGFVRAVEFDPAGNVVEIKTLIEGPAFTTQISTGPDGNLYFVDLGNFQVGRWLLN